ncbi:hypothetical protein V1509DRAFT_59502 [Lipomyces kononenkoae]
MPKTGDNIRELHIFEGAGLKRWTPGSFVASTLASRATITTTSSIPYSNRTKLKSPAPVDNNKQTGKQRIRHRKHVSISDGRRKEWSAEEISSLNIFARFVYGATGNAERVCENVVVHHRLAEILFPGRPYSDVLEQMQIYRRDATDIPVGHAQKRRKTASKLHELQEYANSDQASGLFGHDDADDSDNASNRETWTEKREKLDATLGLTKFGESPSSAGNGISEDFDEIALPVRVKQLDEVLGLGEFASHGAG